MFFFSVLLCLSFSMLCASLWCVECVFNLDSVSAFVQLRGVDERCGLF